MNYTEYLAKSANIRIGTLTEVEAPQTPSIPLKRVVLARRNSAGFVFGAFLMWAFYGAFTGGYFDQILLTYALGFASIITLFPAIKTMYECKMVEGRFSSEDQEKIRYGDWDNIRGYVLLFITTFWPILCAAYGLSDHKVIPGWKLFFTGTFILVGILMRAVRSCRKSEPKDYRWITALS